MKTLNKALIFSLAAVSLTACEDLDVTQYSKYVTSEQKQEVLARNPEMASASVAGIASIMSTYMTTYSNHFDFGYPGIMIGLDLQTNDYVCDWTGYNWYRYWQGFTSPSPSGTPSGMAWYHIFDQIYNCNAVAGSIPADATDATLKFYRAQAVGTRAFDYLVLAQLYQFNYALVGTEAKCVPIITDENQAEAAQNGAPRATVGEVYDQIIKDATEAITLMENTTVTREQCMASKPKRMLSTAVAYGIRARAYMAMHKYTEAAADAQSAIAKFEGAPFEMTDVNHPTFISLDEKSWMWGIAIAETDRVVTSGIVNFPSMMNTFAEGGYVAVGAFKYCDERLFKQIPTTDVRKGWFIDANRKSKNLTAAQQAYINSYGEDIYVYTNVKFGPYKNELPMSVCANDVPLMRIEEMHYIYAEALARSGNAPGAKDYFEKFIKAYRNPTYTMTGSTAEEVAEAIYQDKRVEFWGEGIMFFDMMRLDKGIDRKNSNWPLANEIVVPSYSQDKSAGKDEAGVLIYCIPQAEINANPAISASDNNPSCLAPKP
ncbi:MAG: RagB/SusD family nutrient uptake outer membrane protein [Muribaculaceae bacterium]|nr:RagB/SusD family nutrient uptake outer membrane protein [Muribaculaceae bacterium]